MTASTATRTLPVGTWNLDPAHTHVGFSVDYMVGTFRGSFSPVQAELIISGDGDVSLTGSAPVSGVQVQDENLGAHLQSPEFFDAERAPEITFKSTSVSVSGDEVTVEGDLTIRGVTLPITARGTLSEPHEYMGNERINLILEAQVDRTKFGISWNNPLPNGEPALANQVTLSTELYFVKA